MDEKLTSAIQQWLSSEAKDVPAGAELLLRLNRNRILYHNILRQPQKLLPKLEYELKKHLQIRLDGYTLRQVVVMQQQIMPAVKQTLEAVPTISSEAVPTISSEADGPEPEYCGLRADHDSLPADIQQIPEANRDLYFKIKQLYNTLLTMEKAPACDRYEHLKLLRELDTAYHQNWQRYDHAAPEGIEPAAAAMPAPKEMEAARKFITRNLPKLETLIATGAKEEAINTLRQKLEERLDILRRSQADVSEVTAQRLQALGVGVEP